MESGKEELSPRLQTVSSLIPASDVVIDVGSDHGKLGAFCLLENRCRYLIATDIHEAPARRTADLLRLKGLEHRSRVFCTDGLSGLEIGEDTTIVIAGMGGLEIRKILQSLLEDTGGILPCGITFVLQPQRSFYELRSFLAQYGLRIRKEAISFERNHFYTVMQAIPDEETQELSDAELFLGPCLLKEKPQFFDEYMEHQRKLLEKQALGDERCREILDKWEDFL